MTFEEFKTINRGANGMALDPIERIQRAMASAAYLDAFPFRNGQSYIQYRDSATQYANYQVANQRGWAHMDDMVRI